jgi:hypothetical protein
MPTLRPRPLVSRALLLAVAVATAACAHAPPRDGGSAAARPAAGALAVRFDNEGREYVHVYLVGERREWLLGRVEPGARRMLRLPAEAAGETGYVRLAVLAGEQATLSAVRSPRARLTIAQPAGVLVGQRWMFSQGQLTPLQLPGRAPEGARR